MIIAVDGPAASGKGTLAAGLANHYGLPHLDTGLLYRAVGLAVADCEGSAGFEAKAIDAAHKLETNSLDPQLLGQQHVGDLASKVAVIGEVRRALFDVQRRFAIQAGGAVLDGRDIGTAVVPDADVKIYVTATAAVRAQRRTGELRAKGRDIAYATILAEIMARDARDAGRATAPLAIAPDAVVLDTSALDADAAFERAAAIVDAARGAPEPTGQGPVSPGSAVR
jgi:cytidylate kinase